ncbi:MAG: fumarate hydratase C-terminal domain-containing protein, partial [Thermoplasmata archaeon]|nr:fumarate hydratase C-terminal domain-containing protein [Thermoplasmata archaeon]
KGLGEVKAVYYLDELGMPEAVWVFEAKDFGPLIVSMDSNGHSLYDDVNSKTKENLERLLGD